MRHPLIWVAGRFGRITPNQVGLLIVGLLATAAGLACGFDDAGFGGAGSNATRLAYVDPSGWFDTVLLVVGLLLLASWRFPLGSRRTSLLLFAVLLTLAVWGCIHRGNVAGIMSLSGGDVTVIGALAVAIARNGMRGLITRPPTAADKAGEDGAAV